MGSRISCDIFCRVVDNFGDVGVSWRLAQQLSHEHRLAVRLIVDDLSSFRKLEPTVDCSAVHQEISGISLAKWSDSLELAPASLVIEAFGVDPPDAYVSAMSQLNTAPVWINLEHLSAEAWVGEHHLLPSPHPRLPLMKYFFFPGFTAKTGGLIRERHLMQDRAKFSSGSAPDGLRILLFGYQNAAANSLMDAMQRTATPICCTVPEGALAEDLSQHAEVQSDKSSLLTIVPKGFVPQGAFDRLLWEHDVLFVRGEDSFVRAQWAGKPFVWQIYP
ncbi:MAG: elongation factor P maturation arginine rhamnosyltransferase EarP, partial [Usitatibacteraceae bacterium]